MKGLIAVFSVIILPANAFSQEVVPPVPPPAPAEKSVVQEEIIAFPEVNAEFPGGASALQQHISNHLIYPEVSKDMGDQGKVYLSFVVEKDGNITNIKVERGVTMELDREAKRIIRTMPKWNPGKVNGEPVRTRVYLPLIFRIN